MKTQLALKQYKNTDYFGKRKQKDHLHGFLRSQKFAEIKILADSGYRGMQKIHASVELPHRKTKKHPLTKEKKRENQELASKRVVVENVIGLLKSTEQKNLSNQEKTPNLSF